jgi:hypothetical protein
MMNYRLRIERYTVVKVVADASAELALANAAMQHAAAASCIQAIVVIK